MKNKTIWTRKWPDHEGYWWFYGWSFGDREREPECALLTVRMSGNSVLMVMGNGYFWYPKDGADGWFAEAVMPDPPDIGACDYE